MSGQHYAPANLSLGKEASVPSGQEDGWVTDPAWNWGEEKNP